jgi:hypothetical protein
MAGLQSIHKRHFTAFLQSIDERHFTALLKSIDERRFSALLKQLLSDTVLLPKNQLISVLRSGLRRRGRATTQRALACHRGIAACTRYRAAVVRVFVQIIYKHLGALFSGGRGDARARATKKPFPAYASSPFLLALLYSHSIRN